LFDKYKKYPIDQFDADDFADQIIALDEPAPDELISDEEERLARLLVAVWQSGHLTVGQGQPTEFLRKEARKFLEAPILRSNR